MRHLVKVIGLSPSELSPLALVERLRAERLRVTEGMRKWRENLDKPKKPKKGKKLSGKMSAKAKAATEFEATLMRELGMTLKEFTEKAARGVGEKG